MQIMLHEPEEFPLMADNGFAVEPGTHTLITVRNSEVCHRATHRYNFVLSNCNLGNRTRNVSYTFFSHMSLLCHALPNIQPT